MAIKINPGKCKNCPHRLSQLASWLDDKQYFKKSKTVMGGQISFSPRSDSFSLLTVSIKGKNAHLFICIHVMAP